MDDTLKEPRKRVFFATVVGTSGKGKTTFARRAYEMHDAFPGNLRPQVREAVTECLSAGRSFRVDCAGLTGGELISPLPEDAFATRLLYVALKPRLNE